MLSIKMFNHLREALKRLLPGHGHRAHRNAICHLAIFAANRPGFARGGSMFIHLRIMRDWGGWFDGADRLELRRALADDVCDLLEERLAERGVA